MRRSAFVILVIVPVMAAALTALGGAAAQSRQEPRFAAVPSEKGGQDVFGGYDIVPNWPKPLTSLPGHEKWTWGAGQSVFAESPNRVFVLQRGELPNMPRPMTIKLPQLGPGVEFPNFRLPWRDATFASPPGALEKDGKVGRRSGRGPAGHRLQVGALHHRRERQRRHHRGLDAVGQDVAAAARRLQEPVRSAEGRLDRRRLPPRDLRVHATTARSCSRRSAR